MRRSSKYVGLDVHQDSTVASVRERGGRVIARSIIPTDSPSLSEFFSGMRGRINVAFEEGTQSQWLYELLTPLASRVVVCNLRGERRPGNKDDRGDADHLSRRLLAGDLRPVYHGSSHRQTLLHLTRAYRDVVGNSTRAMQRVKALFRAQATPARGSGIYSVAERKKWLEKLENPGARLRAELLLTEFDLLRELRKRAKAEMIAHARLDPDYKTLLQVPFFGPVRVSLILATMKTPWRFRTKRNLWAYVGLAVLTETSSEYQVIGGRPRRRQRSPLTRGLNKNYNRVLKGVFKGAATAASSRPGPLGDYYNAMLERGMREEMARLTLARKLAAITLRLWKRGEAFDPTLIGVQVT